MEEPILIVKQVKTGYVAIIVGITILFLSLFALGIAMVNITKIDPSISYYRSLTIYIGGIVCILLDVFIYSVIIAYCVINILKQRIEFYKETINIVYGNKQVYQFFYKDIIWYHIFNKSHSCNIYPVKLYHYKRGQIKSHVFDLSFSREDLNQVSEILKVKCLFVNN